MRWQDVSSLIEECVTWRVSKCIEKSACNFLLSNDELAVETVQEMWMCKPPTGDNSDSSLLTSLMGFTQQTLLVVPLLRLPQSRVDSTICDAPKRCRCQTARCVD